MGFLNSCVRLLVVAAPTQATLGSGRDIVVLGLLFGV